MSDLDDKKRKEEIGALRAKEEEALAQILSKKYDLPYIDLTTGQHLQVEALKNIDEASAREAHTIAFSVSGRKLAVATTKPDTRPLKNILDALERKGFTPVLFLVSNSGLQKGLDMYKEISLSLRTKSGVLTISKESIGEHAQKVKTLDDSKEIITSVLNSEDPYYVTILIEAIVASALSLGASDIHIEPTETGALIRFRLDGILYDVNTLDKKVYKQLSSRIKLLSGLKINITNNAQDGRFTIDLGNKEIEIRTSALPGDNGESFVMRLLDPDSIAVSMEELGIHPVILEIIKKEIHKPNGMILNTGPTGSGKTTTLYTFLKHIQKSEIKIITIENPIEYHIPGIVQTQTSKGGLTFAEGLRSIVRQDPDVIMVGEIRDGETAGIAIQAALTGHLVLSTLHTNTAAATFSRLIDLGSDPKTLGAAINVAMAQRLVRRLCPSCKKETPLSEEEKNLAEKLLENLPNTIEKPQTDYQFTPEGCDKCSGRGYKGRVGIFDIVLVDEELEELLHEKENPSQREIRKAVQRQGLLTIEQDAILKVLNGMSSFEEVRRVIDL